MTRAPLTSATLVPSAKQSAYDAVCAGRCPAPGVARAFDFSRRRQLEGAEAGSPYAARHACGVGFIARQSGERTHEVVQLALPAAARMEHRGAQGADLSADGAGLLTQIPRRLFILVGSRQGVRLPADASIAVGLCFLPADHDARLVAERVVEQVLVDDGLPCLGWRDVPTNPEILSPSARAAMPRIRQVMIDRPSGSTEDAWERALNLARREMKHRIDAIGLVPCCICSLSCRTIVYKGLVTGAQLPEYFADLRKPSFETAIAAFHERDATNTMPRWQLAQPFRQLAHNGEINTLWGNRNGMAMRDDLLAVPTFGEFAERVRMPIRRNGSDSASLDNAFELLVRDGQSPVHAPMMLVPRAWDEYPDIDPTIRAFYEYHQCVIEPWDGPAALAYRDGVPFRRRSTAVDSAPVAARFALMAWPLPVLRSALAPLMRAILWRRAKSDRVVCCWWTRPVNALCATLRRSVKSLNRVRMRAGLRNTWRRFPRVTARSRSCSRAVSSAQSRCCLAPATKIYGWCRSPWPRRALRWRTAWR